VNSLLDCSDESDIVYVDTVGTFRPERIVEMSGGNRKKEYLLKHILSIRARTWTEQVEAPFKINDLTSRKVGILIIDTLTDNFVYEFQTGRYIRDRQIALARHLHELAMIAIEEEIAVVVTNTVRNKIPENRNTLVTETGGNTVSQGVHLRLRLGRDNKGWLAQLNNDEKSIRFKIGERGLMD
jgi:RecA/RadA recombinase